MNDIKISSRQLTWLIIGMALSTPTLTMPRVLIFYCKQNAWLPLLLAISGVVTGVLLCTTLAKKFPGQTIAQYSQILLGKWGGRTVGLFYGLGCLLISALSARSYAQLFQIAIMPETPLWAFVISLTLVCVYMAWQGVEPITRTNDIFVPITLISLLLILLPAFPQGKLYYALPNAGFNFEHTISAAIIPFGYLSEIASILFLAPILNKQEELKASCLKGLFAAGALLLIITQLVLFVMGTYRASSYIFPLLNIAEEFYVLNVFEKFEPLLLAAWLTLICMKSSLFIYLFAVSTSQATSPKVYRYLILAALVAVPAIALASPNLAVHKELVTLFFKTLSPISLIVIPMFLLLITKIRHP
ncbi:MAG TPA: endospore germination permease [Candidatus Deferrimicrobium sp.]|nr:endospore germination permease [Candidatus Deferrimicrobium sp.]